MRQQKTIPPPPVWWSLDRCSCKHKLHSICARCGRYPFNTPPPSPLAPWDKNACLSSKETQPILDHAEPLKWRPSHIFVNSSIFSPSLPLSLSLSLASSTFPLLWLSVGTVIFHSQPSPNSSRSQLCIPVSPGRPATNRSGKHPSVFQTLLQLYGNQYGHMNILPEYMEQEKRYTRINSQPHQKQAEERAEV